MNRFVNCDVPEVQAAEVMSDGDVSAVPVAEANGPAVVEFTSWNRCHPSLRPGITSPCFEPCSLCEVHSVWSLLRPMPWP